jgi:hypothetical protein
LIGGFGRQLVALLTPWASHGRAAAVDSPLWKTSGGVWHKKHKEQGERPYTSMETEAGWSKSGWHGWWYGWQLPLAVSVGAVWRPLAAALTAANTAANTIAPQLWAPLPAEVRYILGDTPYNDPEVRVLCEQSNRALVATRRGAYPHSADGVAVQRIFHTRWSQAIEPFNGLCKNIFAWRPQMPVQGLRRSQLLAVGAIVIYPLVLLYQHEHNLPLGKGIKPLLRAA